MPIDTEEKNELQPTKELTEKQKLFCNYYVSEDYFGNGVRAYIAAYDAEYETAKTNAGRLLRDAHICSHIGHLLDDAGLNDNHVDKQLLYAINQMDNIPAKVSAIKEYNAMNSRVKKRVITEVVITDEEKKEVETLLAANLGSIAVEESISSE